MMAEEGNEHEVTHVSIRQAAVLLRCSEWLVARLMARGELSFEVMDGRPRILATAVRDFYRKQGGGEHDDTGDLGG